VFVLLPLLLPSVRLITLYEVLSLHLRKDVLKTCSLFQGLRPSQIKKLVLISEVREVQAGELIVSEGDRGDEMFVLLEGTVQVEKNQPDGSRQALDQLSPGQVFGEMALVTQHPRSATVVALSPGKLLVLKWDGIQRISRIYPRTSSRVFQNLSAVLSQRLEKEA
jgi:CRP-like cAMP-binding protein